MTILYDTDVWHNVDTQDLWVFDKLILSRKLGYLCGPVGVPVPKPGKYIVRPCTNLMGMSLGATIETIQSSTEHLPAGYFWCEVFHGRHLTYDFIEGRQAVCYQGFLEPGSVNRFTRWVKTDDIAVIPEFVKQLSHSYQHINIECIGDKIIEIHLRGNPDWIQHNSKLLIPLWSDGVSIDIPAGKYQFVSDQDQDRVGFLKLL